ncbi:MAG: hypothetical protein Q7T03_09115 [Deltaproteobacteria bacterium]|nr:hypothetical protein [Deltaproteobacteria bacterium]
MKKSILFSTLVAVIAAGALTVGCKKSETTYNPPVQPVAPVVVPVPYPAPAPEAAPAQPGQ